VHELRVGSSRVSGRQGEELTSGKNDREPSPIACLFSGPIFKQVQYVATNSPFFSAQEILFAGAASSPAQPRIWCKISSAALLLSFQLIRRAPVVAID
jgi:hypothetical protein